MRVFHYISGLSLMFIILIFCICLIKLIFPWKNDGMSEDLKSDLLCKYSDINDISSKGHIIADTINLQCKHERRFIINNLDTVNILVYEVTLDTAEIILTNNQLKGLQFTAKEDSNDFFMLTNGGMFHPEGEPVGYFAQDGETVKKINKENGNGNFFLLPNGVFFVTDDNKAGVLETNTFSDSILEKGVNLRIATQSGPMLLIDGEPHPKFNCKSKNINVRSGVGVTYNQKLIFIISINKINFYNFASVFLKMGCTNALYLDGVISEMFIKEMRQDISSFKSKFGPVIGVCKR